MGGGLSVGNGDQASGLVDIPDGDLMKFADKFQTVARSSGKKHGIGQFLREKVKIHSWFSFVCLFVVKVLYIREGQELRWRLGRSQDPPSQPKFWSL